MAKKLFPDAKSALDGILKNDIIIASGGFGLCGISCTGSSTKQVVCDDEMLFVKKGSMYGAPTPLIGYNGAFDALRNKQHAIS